MLKISQSYRKTSQYFLKTTLNEGKSLINKLFRFITKIPNDPEIWEMIQLE